MQNFHQACSCFRSQQPASKSIFSLPRPWLSLTPLLSLALALTMMSVPVAQAAESVAKELRGYRSLEIKLDDDAADCALDTRDKEIRAHAVSAMEKLDLIETSDAQVDASLIVGNIAFGPLNVECALHVELSFHTSIPAQNITGVNAETREVLDRMGALPVKVWSRSAFGVAAQRGLTKEEAFEKAYIQVTEMTDLLVDIIAEQRQ